MRKDDINGYLGREVKVETISGETFFGVLIYENGFYKMSFQEELKLKHSDIKNIYYLKS